MNFDVSPYNSCEIFGLGISGTFAVKGQLQLVNNRRNKTLY